MPRYQSSFLCSIAIAVLATTTAYGLDEPEHARLIDAIADTLQHEYIYPEVAAEMAVDLRERAKRGEYAAIYDNTALAKRLTQDLRAVSHDKHLGVEYHVEGARTAPTTLTPDARDRWRTEAARENFAFRKVERMDGNIGYLELRGFHELDLAARIATAAMTFVANCDALIIDLRANRGGDPQMVAFLASFFFDERTHLNDIVVRDGNRLDQYWTSLQPGPIFGGSKPLYLLTSKSTFSGAEDFTYALQNLKRAVVVGETTGGGAHPTRQFKVSEHFGLMVPFARSLSPITHKDWEGTGVTPDVAVPARDALSTAYRAALQRIAAATQDAQQKQALEALLAAQKR